ncbi:hypothetical protein NPIL_269341, partial [Nephila pilipes]
AVVTMVPEAWQKDKLMNEHKKHFYQWSSCIMEPWDGPGMFKSWKSFSCVYHSLGFELINSFK